jgi:hypothetical protein
MKKFKKILAAFLLVLAIGGLTACSQMNKVTTNFEDQGYVRYKYNNNGNSLLFSIHDDLFVEESLRLVEEDTNTDQTTTSTEDDANAVDADNSGVYYGFLSYAFSNDDYVVVIMEFESENFLLERLAESAVLQAALEGKDVADYVNGNCLLIVPTNYDDQYDSFVEIFQGLADPIVE